MRQYLQSVCCLLYFYASQLVAGNEEVKKTAYAVTVSGTFKLEFSDSPALPTLKEWSKELGKHGHTVTHDQAVEREMKIVQMIDSGQWPTSVYAEYQRMAAGTGNVDSARLLLEYGLNPTVVDVIKRQDDTGSLHSAAVLCHAPSVSGTYKDEALIDAPADDGTTPLITASFKGCLPVVIALTEEGADVEAVGMHGMTALMAAAASGHTKVVQKLIKKGGAKVNRQHRFAGSTALHMAAEMGYADVIVELCKNKANVTARTSLGSTPLHVAADTGAATSVIALLGPPCNANTEVLLNNDTTPLYLAALKGHISAVHALIKGGASVSYAMPRHQERRETHVSVSGSSAQASGGKIINSKPGNGAEPIHAAAENGHVEIVRALLRAGADVESTSVGVTPLIIAAQHGKVNVVKALLQPDIGANIEARSVADGATALYHASGLGYEDVVIELIHAGADINARQRRAGGFPLLYAAGKGNTQVVRILLQAGADPNLSADNGMSALQTAAAIDSKDIAQLLLDAGADPLAADHEGRSALHAAVMSGGTHTLSLLLKRIRKQLKQADHTGANADVDMSGSRHVLARTDKTDGASAFHIACIQGRLEAIKLFLGAGVDPNHRMSSKSYGATPLYVAIRSKRLDVVRTLLANGAAPDQALEAPSYITPLLTAIEIGM